MQLEDVQKMADSVLRQYGVPMKVAAISAVASGWTVAFAGFHPGSKPVEVRLGCDRSSAYHVRESLKLALDVGD